MLKYMTVRKGRFVAMERFHINPSVTIIGVTKNQLSYGDFK